MDWIAGLKKYRHPARYRTHHTTGYPYCRISWHPSFLDILMKSFITFSRYIFNILFLIGKPSRGRCTRSHKILWSAILYKYTLISVLTLQPCFGSGSSRIRIFVVLGSSQQNMLNRTLPYWVIFEQFTPFEKSKLRFSSIKKLSLLWSGPGKKLCRQSG